MWLGSVSEHMGEWMENAAILWLVNEMTGSPFMATLVTFARMGPLAVFSFVGGLVVDRISRRNVLIIALLASTLLSFTLLVLVRSGSAAMWSILLISFLGGVATSFNHPARQTMVPNLVKREHLMNAISLDTTSVMASRVIATPIAGILIHFYGVTPVLGLRAAGAGIAIIWLLFIPSMLPPKNTQKRNPLQDLKQGFAYLRGQPVMLGQVIFWGLPSLAHAAFTALLPAFSKDVLHVGPVGYGFLQSATGLGSVVSLLTLATLGKVRRRGLTILASGMGMGLAFVGFAYSPWFAASVLLAIAVGSTNTSLTTVNNTVIQELLSDQMRGRVMSLREVMTGLGPGASLLVGSAAELTTLTVATAGLGAIIVAVPLALLLLPTRMRRL
ncbi:MAG: MFS transporter [Chloroflexi bacterium]|nr:MFS transporter [Chloroflexota bacterium]